MDKEELTLKALFVPLPLVSGSFHVPLLNFREITLSLHWQANVQPKLLPLDREKLRDQRNKGVTKRMFWWNTHQEDIESLRYLDLIVMDKFVL